MEEDGSTDKQERYIIGFTENQYRRYSDNSPSPIDHLFGYSSAALDYAERFNKGTENIFQDRTNLLDKQRSKSVGKINTNILDLVFELTERRKVTGTPLLSRSPRLDLSQRPSSRLSDCSEVSIKTSSSLPLIQVQQLPPLLQCYSMPSLDQSFSGIPDTSLSRSLDSRPTTKPKQKKKKKKTKLTKPEEKMNTKQEPPKLYKVVRTLTELHKKQQQANHDSKSVSNINDGKSTGTQNRPKTVPTLEKNIKGETVNEVLKQPQTSQPSNVDNKWTRMTQKLVDTQVKLKNERDSFSAYAGKKATKQSSGRAYNNLSFCQSSYNERSEKERIDNIRRRHTSQVNTGPLDFNKLKRQITARSNTMYW